jgi:two-component system, NarL family, response regulator DesR
MKIRVLIAEDQAMVRGALAALLALEDDIEVVVQVPSGDLVVPAALEHRPDVALLDIEMPGMDGLSASAALREALPGCRTLILTTFGRPGYLRRAMDQGAYGFLVKDTPATELAGAIRRAAAGQRTVDPGLAAAALAEGSSPLSAREREVLGAAVGGATIADIADIAGRLFLSEGTVRNHISAAIRKTGAAQPRRGRQHRAGEGLALSGRQHGAAPEGAGQSTAPGTAARPAGGSRPPGGRRRPGGRHGRRPARPGRCRRPARSRTAPGRRRGRRRASRP